MVFKKDFHAKAQRCKETAQRRIGSVFASSFAPLRLCVSIFFCFLFCFASCKREQRQFSQPPSSFKSYDVTMSDLHPGSSGLPQPVQNPSDQRAFDTNEGKRLYSQYNCAGCHFNGGGG